MAATPAAAYALAGDLATLIDRHDHRRRALGEDQDPCARGLRSLTWGITLESSRSPSRVGRNGSPSTSSSTERSGFALLIDDEIKALAGGARRGPTIIAGSTGANRATARLIAAIAHAPLGAVVLPDLDLDLDEDAWALIGASDDVSRPRGPPSIARCAADRRDWRQARRSHKARRAIAGAQRRSAFLTEALRPAEFDERWRERENALSPPAVATALAGVSLVVADNENEEALALAIAMRENFDDDRQDGGPHHA